MRIRKPTSAERQDALPVTCTHCGLPLFHRSDGYDLETRIVESRTIPFFHVVHRRCVQDAIVEMVQSVLAS